MTEADQATPGDSTIDPAAPESDAPGQPYADAVLSFSRSIEDLREIVETLGPVVEDLDDPRSLTSESPEGLVDAVLKFTSFASEIDDGADSEDSFELSFEVDSPEEAAKAIRIVRAIVRRSSGATRSEILYQALLVSAVGYFEELVGSLWREWYSSDSQRLGESEKRFSLADFASLGSVSEAVNHATNERVEALLFKGFDSWGGWYEKHKVARFEDLACDWPLLLETFQRRHAVVHNGAVASQRYIEVTGLEGEISVGEPLDTSARYLSASLDQLLAFGVNMAVAIWVKDHGDKGKAIAAFVLGNVIYPQMLEARWEVVETVGRRALLIAGSGYEASAIQCDVWLAKKHLSGVKAIDNEVRAWDISALRPTMALVKYALLDDVDRAFMVLPDVLERMEISSADLAEWPILEPLRNDPRYTEQRGDAKPTVTLKVERSPDRNAYPQTHD